MIHTSPGERGSRGGGRGGKHAATAVTSCRCTEAALHSELPAPEARKERPQRELVLGFSGSIFGNVSIKRADHRFSTMFGVKQNQKETTKPRILPHPCSLPFSKDHCAFKLGSTSNVNSNVLVPQTWDAILKWLTSPSWHYWGGKWTCSWAFQLRKELARQGGSSTEREDSHCVKCSLHKGGCKSCLRWWVPWQSLERKHLCLPTALQRFISASSVLHISWKSCKEATETGAAISWWIFW